jgi:capsule polysaccharide export protein KpsC/LpsZ
MIHKKIKHYIKIKTSDFIKKLIIEVSENISKEIRKELEQKNLINIEVSQKAAIEFSENIAKEIRAEVEKENLVNMEKFNKLISISFELSKKLNFVLLPQYNINPWEYYKNKQFGFWFGDFFEILLGKEPIPNIFCAGLNCVLSDKPLKFTPNENNLDDVDILLLWGQSSKEGHINMIYNALLKQKKILFIEDGFFYNVISHVKSLQKEYPSYLSQGMSFTIDDVTAHFDGSLPSRLEQMINSDIVLEEDQLIRSRKLINNIVENKLTKYNYQSIEAKVYGCKNSKVLVVDQAYGDYSVYKSGASEEVFIQMIKDAISENPESDILVKIHPDMIVNPNRGGAKNGGYFGNMQINHPNLIIIKDEINPYVIIEQVQSIYVCTSQLGFEALMSGKKVYCYGVPFYSGWGLTFDRGNSEYLKRREKSRSVEELFWFAYICYSRYYSPLKQKSCEIEEVLQTIKSYRTKLIEEVLW